MNLLSDMLLVISRDDSMYLLNFTNFIVSNYLCGVHFIVIINRMGDVMDLLSTHHKIWSTPNDHKTCIIQ